MASPYIVRSTAYEQQRVEQQRYALLPSIASALCYWTDTYAPGSGIDTLREQRFLPYIYSCTCL
jgi:hypothetical protein